MVRNSTEPRVPSKKVFEAISEGLAEIEAYVDFPGLASTRSEPEAKEPVSESGSAQAGAVQEEESGDEDYYGDDSDSDGLGMVGRGSLFADNLSIGNGSASREVCWDRSSSSFL